MSKDYSFLPLSKALNRREFVAAAVTALGAATFLSSPKVAKGASLSGKDSLTVQQVIDLVLKEIPNAPFPNTVDTLKSGTGGIVVTGIVTTMFATIEVIRKAIGLKANFIIAHEPTFYNHADETGWLETSKVYQYKRDLLAKNNIAVWRCHDYIHAHNPDGVRMGVLAAMGWEQYYNPTNTRMMTIPSMTLGDIAKNAKKKLGIKQVRLIGDLNQPCARIALLPGASGGRSHIQTLFKEEPDLLICGELQEWETSEYVRDARAMGMKTSLLVLGHAVSEEPGLEWLVPWLEPKVNGLKVTHVPSGNPLSFL